MRTAAIVFVAAASLAAALVFGLVNLGGSRNSLTPIELRGFDGAMRPHSSRTPDAVVPPRTMIPQHVDETTFSSDRAQTLTRAAR